MKGQQIHGATCTFDGRAGGFRVAYEFDADINAGITLPVVDTHYRHDGSGIRVMIKARTRREVRDLIAETGRTLDPEMTERKVSVPTLFDLDAGAA